MTPVHRRSRCEEMQVIDNSKLIKYGYLIL